MVAPTFYEESLFSDFLHKLFCGENWQVAQKIVFTLPEKFFIIDVCVD